MKFAQRTNSLKPSPTLALNARAKKMQADGIDVINFTCGEPDFDTPDRIKRAAEKAIKDGFTKYTASGGILELKDAIIGALKREQGLEYKREEIIVSPGAKYSIFVAMQALIGKGDEVIIPAPYWVSYPDQTMLMEGTPVIVQAGKESNFKLTASALEKTAGKNSKIVILNSPSNPTGMAYTEAELKDIARVCVEKDLMVISDEIYDGIVFDGFKCKSIATFPGMKERTIIINGVSKKFAMTGWRMGFAAGDASLVKKMTDIQGQALTSVCSITQKACVEAYNGPSDDIDKMVESFSQRRNFIVEKLNAMGLSCIRPNGAFYAFPSIEKVIGKTLGGKKINSSADLAEYLLEHAHIATVPGEAFGIKGFIRLSFATSMKNIEEGLKRLEKAIN